MIVLIQIYVKLALHPRHLDERSNEDVFHVTYAIEDVSLTRLPFFLRRKPPRGFEPLTGYLQSSCSTAELRGQGGDISISYLGTYHCFQEDLGAMPNVLGGIAPPIALVKLDMFFFRNSLSTKT